ncbi:MAG: carboxypeptidase-like regulatory domain-containing protein, partial [Acidobacteria bacterium]|nr:carboxypeptidase-like regulatory domain-containing protein [Acidobacteriota bacterium]
MRKFILVSGVLLLCGASAALSAITGVAMTEDGTPLAGVEVTAFEMVPEAQHLARWMSTEPAREPVASAKTDSKGKFSLTVETTGIVELTIEAAGFVAAQRLAIQSMDLGAVPLPEGKAFRGVVVGGEGPVAEATIVTGSNTVHITGEDGAFSLTLRDTNAPRLRVYHPDFAPLDIPQGRASRIEKLQLSKGVAVRGNVKDSKGEPVSGAFITVDGHPYGSSGEDGSFTLERVSATWKEITAVEGSRIATASRIGKRPEYSLRLAPGATISGTVRNTKSGANEPGVVIGITPAEQILPSTRQVLTDAKGAFSIGPIAPGRYRLLAHSPALAPSETDIAVSGGAGVRRDFSAEPLSVISGTVTDQNRRPVAAAMISASEMGREELMMLRRSLPSSAWSGPDGVFVYRTPGERNVTLEAKRRGLPSGRSEPLDLQAGATRSGVRIVVPRGIEVAGTVTSVSGDPLRGASIRFTPATGPQQMMIRRVISGA